MTQVKKVKPKNKYPDKDEITKPQKGNLGVEKAIDEFINKYSTQLVEAERPKPKPLEWV